MSDFPAKTGPASSGGLCLPSTSLSVSSGSYSSSSIRSSSYRFRRMWRISFFGLPSKESAKLNESMFKPKVDAKSAVVSGSRGSASASVSVSIAVSLSAPVLSSSSFTAGTVSAGAVWTGILPHWAKNVSNSSYAETPKIINTSTCLGTRLSSTFSSSARVRRSTRSCCWKLWSSSVRRIFWSRRA
ncbi:hypothetical protein CLUG_02076 [Clavispora lusitaniae ATCC 42720]|uniref:Uncharacterized protein n=1 Tax=Clavispora lusitaniae (strain ATCC 42720) TaxID=306902 RepID=C4Y1J4_CLAL4|nr:uncharacterized protein CLUG_02076 [Clavispora lusitaniae ATCC 42720]EEQ37952.1 hypothetical protein CLUG_02076 [Clavispora lusitaniae ATCC 42720]